MQIKTPLKGIMVDEKERTFVLIKPDGVSKGLIGKIISEIERKKLEIVAMKLLRMTKRQAEDLYREHFGKTWFSNTIEFFTGAPVVALVVEGEEAVETVRQIVGRDPRSKNCHLGSIRIRFGSDPPRNIVHKANSRSDAEREAKIFFRRGEYVR